MIGRKRLIYNHPHDIAALIEVFALDVYGVKQIPRNAIVFDLGSGIGDFAVLAASRVCKGGKVISIEPNPEDFKLLSLNLAINNHTNVVAQNVELSSRQFPSNLSFKGTSFITDPKSLPAILAAAGLTIDGACRHPIVIKMDIEGAEVQAIQDLNSILSNVTLIAIEMHGTKKLIDEILIPKGFSFSRLRRVNYLSKSFVFLLKHPLSAIVIWRRFRRLPEFPGIRKLFSGIQVASSDDLVVGIYRRTS